MTPVQRQVAEAIASGPRGGLGGPFQTWLRSPDLADRLQKVGEYLRFSSAVPRRLNELAILITARAWDAQYEWYAHHRMAMEAGLDPAVAADIAEGRRPAAMQADEAVVYDFCTELRAGRNVSDATLAAVLEILGEQGVVDLIAVSGYYDIVSMTLNVAEVALPDGLAPPLAPTQADPVAMAAGETLRTRPAVGPRRVDRPGPTQR
ncbi:MAG TPA: carboxymuconolactone decarboxylase family protein [Caulobacteraceae bacterium]|nr:carboxymuconolactone decarboxylase family protein [Caulobacteraceae bacterium]